LKEQSWPLVLKNFVELVENFSSIKGQNTFIWGSSDYENFTGLDCKAKNSKEDIYFDKKITSI